MPIEASDLAQGPAIPLARWADRQLRALAEITGSPRISELDGPTILGERGSANGFVINGKISAGIGGSRLMPTRDGGWFALTILREIDRELLPALFGGGFDVNDNEAIAQLVAANDCADLVERGRLLGLPVASAHEVPRSAPVEVMTRGSKRIRESGHRPLVIDMSAIWAGPLAGHLLWLAGADVVKVESLTRPDLMRRDDPATFDLINQGKANIVVDFDSESQKAALVQLIRQADFVIESSRPRALLHLGIDADALVREVHGLVWLSITAHGATGEAANWVGVGNDCCVASGLSLAMEQAGGELGYVGDAITDPLTGITAAIEGWQTYRGGEARRIGFAMSAIGARALREERDHDAAPIEQELRDWSAAVGRRFRQIPQRPMLAEVRPLGADTAQWLGTPAPC